MAVVLITDLPGNGVHGQRSGAEQITGHADAHLFDESKQLNATFLSVQITKICRRKTDPVRKCTERQFFIAVQRDIRLYRIQWLVKGIDKPGAQGGQSLLALLNTF
jgi:hypothetical protein